MSNFEQETDLAAWVVQRGQELMTLTKRPREKVRIAKILEAIWRMRPDLRPKTNIQ